MFPVCATKATEYHLVNFMTLVPHAGQADFSKGLPLVVVPRWTFASSTATFFLHLRQYISIIDCSPRLGTVFTEHIYHANVKLSKMNISMT